MIHFNNINQIIHSSYNNRKLLINIYNNFYNNFEYNNDDLDFESLLIINSVLDVTNKVNFEFDVLVKKFYNKTAEFKNKFEKDNSNYDGIYFKYFLNEFETEYGKKCLVEFYRTVVIDSDLLEREFVAFSSLNGNNENLGFINYLRNIDADLVDYLEKNPKYLSNFLKSNFEYLNYVKPKIDVYSYFCDSTVIDSLLDYYKKMGIEKDFISGMAPHIDLFDDYLIMFLIDKYDIKSCFTVKREGYTCDEISTNFNRTYDLVYSKDPFKLKGYSLSEMAKFFCLDQLFCHIKSLTDSYKKNINQQNGRPILRVLDNRSKKDNNK